MTTPILERVLRGSETADLLEVLTQRLTPTDLQSLLLEVYGRRAAQQTPASLLAHYERSRFVRPADASPQALLEFDRLAFSLAVPPFHPLELAPVCPLGTASVVALVSQNNAVTTSRNTELLSDSTNVLALECAVRRRAALRVEAGKKDRVRLCASHRLLRPQKFDGPGAFAHFRLFALCTAGRDEGADRFKVEALFEHLAFYCRLLSALKETGGTMRTLRVAVTSWTGDPAPLRLHSGVLEPLAAEFPDAQVAFDPGRSAGRGYYEGTCFHIYAADHEGTEHLLVDGGLTNWTQQLLSSKKERLLISGIGSERVCSLFGSER